MKQTIKQIILNVLRARGGWVNLWDLCNKNTECGFLPVSARSRVQELAQEGKVEHILGSKDNPLVQGKYSWYRIKPVQYQTYKVLLPTGEVDKEIKVPV